MAEIIVPPQIHTARVKYQISCHYCRQGFVAPYGSIKYCSLFCAFWRWVAPPYELGCCLWLGRRDTGGYGQFSFRGKSYMATHVCRQLHGLKTDKRLDVMHSCHRPRCVALEHILEQGTRSQNLLQSVRDSRPIGRPLTRYS